MIAIGAVRIGAAVRSDTNRPYVSTMASLRRDLAGAEQVLLALAPTGDHMMKVIERFGLTATIAPKLRRFDTATLLNKYLTEHPGVKMLGISPATEIKAWHDKGVAWAGPIPDEIQIVLPYSAAMLTSAPAEPSKKLLTYLATPTARQHFLKSGIE